jgi:hypothetical protein
MLGFRFTIMVPGGNSVSKFNRQNDTLAAAQDEYFDAAKRSCQVQVGTKQRQTLELPRL